jgi:hypothetical protein
MTATQPTQQFFALERDDVLHLEKQRAFVHELARRLDLSPTFSGGVTDLQLLQKIVDSKALSADQTWELQSLGIVLGDVFAKQFGLRWVIVEDEYGRDPALRFMTTSNLVFPLTMISKRVEDGGTVDLHAIYEGYPTVSRNSTCNREIAGSLRHQALGVEDARMTDRVIVDSSRSFVSPAGVELRRLKAVGRKNDHDAALRERMTLDRNEELAPEAIATQGLRNP